MNYEIAATLIMPWESLEKGTGKWDGPRMTRIWRMARIEFGFWDGKVGADFKS
jgi:hypothetical protein